MAGTTHNDVLGVGMCPKMWPVGVTKKRKKGQKLSCVKLVICPDHPRQHRPLKFCVRGRVPEVVSSFMKIGPGVTELWEVENRPLPLTRPISSAFTTLRTPQCTVDLLHIPRDFRVCRRFDHTPYRIRIYNSFWAINFYIRANRYDEIINRTTHVNALLMHVCVIQCGSDHPCCLLCAGEWLTLFFTTTLCIEGNIGRMNQLILFVVGSNFLVLILGS